MTSPITRKLRNRIKTINKDDNITKQIMEFALEGNVDSLKGFVLQNRSDFDMIIKVMRFFGMDMKGIPYTYTPPTCLCPVYLVKDIKKQMVRLIKVRGNPTNANRKAKEKFIDVILNTFIGELECFIIKDKEALSHGNVEYVFFTGAGFIGLLLEAKMEDIRQGFAQLLIEMFMANRMNLARGFKQSRFFGILSTAEVWYFVEYCNEAKPPFRSSRAFHLGLDQDEPDIFNQFLNTFYAFVLDTWIESVDIWHSRANAMVASVVDDSDPEPANTTDIEDLSTLAGAIQQSKQHLDRVRSADTDEKACYALPLLVASIYKVNEMITKWDADLSSAVLQFNA